jgi:hypothetical protein
LPAIFQQIEIEKSSNFFYEPVLFPALTAADLYHIKMKLFDI